MDTTQIIALAALILGSNGILQFGITTYFKRKDHKENRNDLMLETLSIMSYCNLKNEGQRLIDKGHASPAERRFLHKMHDNYSEWGWNGDMDAMMDAADDLPYRKELPK